MPSSIVKDNIKGEQKKTLQTKVGGNYSALQSPRVKKLEFFQLPGPCRFEKCHWFAS